MLKIWGRKNSSNVRKALWCAEELGLVYQAIDAGGAFGVVDTPEYRAKNPNGRVPMIEEDGFVRIVARADGRGAEGLDAPLIKQAAFVLSLGAMTWPHMLVRAMLAEQLKGKVVLITGGNGADVFVWTSAAESSRPPSRPTAEKQPARSPTTGRSALRSSTTAVTWSWVSDRLPPTVDRKAVSGRNITAL